MRLRVGVYVCGREVRVEIGDKPNHQLKKENTVYRFVVSFIVVTIPAEHVAAASYIIVITKNSTGTLNGK